MYGGNESMQGEEIKEAWSQFELVTDLEKAKPELYIQLVHEQNRMLEGLHCDLDHLVQSCDKMLEKTNEVQYGVANLNGTYAEVTKTFKPPKNVGDERLIPRSQPALFHFIVQPYNGKTQMPVPLIEMFMFALIASAQFACAGTFVYVQKRGFYFVGLTTELRTTISKSANPGYYGSDFAFGMARWYQNFISWHSWAMVDLIHSLRQNGIIFIPIPIHHDFTAFVYQKQIAPYERMQITDAEAAMFAHLKSLSQDRKTKTLT
jgi:hypothetical protein